MKILDKIKAKAVIWAITAFTDEKYKARRAILTPIIRAKIDAYLGENKMADQQQSQAQNQPQPPAIPMWKSKAVIAAVVTVIVGAIQPISTALGHPIVVPDWVVQVLAGIGIYGIRDAVGKNSALK
jgi:hypothetical protein